MSDVPPSDVVARGRAIFDRLRAGDGPEVEATMDPSVSSNGAEHEAAAERDQEVDRQPSAEAGAEPDPTLRDGDAVVEAEAVPVVEAQPVPAAEEHRSEAGVPEEDLGAAAELVDEAPVELEHPPVAVDLQDVAEPETPQGQPGTEAAPAPAPAPVARSPFARDLPRVLAIANQKGGVGKTTTAVNLGASLADLGYRVLVVDLDPQGNASTGLGINTRDLQSSMYDVMLRDTPLEDCIEATSVRNLFVAPASLDLAGAEIELVSAFSRELRLRRALGDVLDDFDFVLVDCPPSLGLLTVNSLAAAGEVLVPIQCEYYALEGLGQLMRNVTLVQKNLNPILELSIIVLVMYDARTKLSDQVVREVRGHFGDKVCRTVVPRTVRLSEAPSYGQPIIAFDPSSRGAIAYRELAKEVSGGTPQRAG